MLWIVDGWFSILGRLMRPFEWIDARVTPVAKRNVLLQGLWSLTKLTFSWLTFPILLARLFVPALAFSAVIAIFWIAPTVIWLSVFHHLSVIDAATYAATLANGPPEYAGPFGTNRDPSLIGFAVFNVLAWVVMLAPFAVIFFGALWLRDWREMRHIEREIS